MTTPNQALIGEAEERLASVREQLSRTPERYAAIRDLWKAHSLAEDARSIPGLLATLTPDCVYEVVQTGDRWEGHEGATRFYTELLTAFPDIKFNLTNIVIGPQGVCEEAVVTGTHLAPWQGREPSNEHLAWRVVIFFPWDEEAELFTGERVYVYFPGDEDQRTASSPM